jgi:hypothetical protein
MQAGENIISRIIDLDTRAESIRVRAREEAENIHKEAVRDAEKQKQDLEIRIVERIKKISAETARKRSEEVEKVKKEYANQVEGIRTISSEQKNRAVNIVLSGMRGHSE